MAISLTHFAVVLISLVIKFFGQIRRL